MTAKELKANISKRAMERPFLMKACLKAAATKQAAIEIFDEVKNSEL